MILFRGFTGFVKCPRLSLGYEWGSSNYSSCTQSTAEYLEPVPEQLGVTMQESENCHNYILLALTVCTRKIRVIILSV